MAFKLQILQKLQIMYVILIIKVYSLDINYNTLKINVKYFINKTITIISLKETIINQYTSKTYKKY